MVSATGIAGGYCDLIDSIFGANANWGECDLTASQQQDAYEEGNPYSTPYGSGPDLGQKVYDVGKLALLFGGVLLAVKVLDK